jgi:hypothetical protein
MHRRNPLEVRPPCSYGAFGEPFLLRPEKWPGHWAAELRRHRRASLGHESNDGILVRTLAPQGNRGLMLITTNPQQQLWEAILPPVYQDLPAERGQVGQDRQGARANTTVGPATVAATRTPACGPGARRCDMGRSVVPRGQAHPDSNTDGARTPPPGSGTQGPG